MRFDWWFVASNVADVLLVLVGFSIDMFLWRCARQIAIHNGSFRGVVATIDVELFLQCMIGGHMLLISLIADGCGVLRLGSKCLCALWRDRSYPLLFVVLRQLLVEVEGVHLHGGRFRAKGHGTEGWIDVHHLLTPEWTRILVVDVFRLSCARHSNVIVLATFLDGFDSGWFGLDARAVANIVAFMTSAFETHTRFCVVIVVHLVLVEACGALRSWLLVSNYQWVPF